MDFPERQFLSGLNYWRRLTTNPFYVQFKRIERYFQDFSLLRYLNWRKNNDLHDEGLTIAIYATDDNSGMAKSYRYEIVALQKLIRDLIVLDANKPVEINQEIISKFNKPIKELYLFGGVRKLKTFMKHFKPEQIRHSRRIAYWVYEAPRVPRTWKLAFEFVHCIITPSEFSAQAIRASAGSIPVVVQSHPVAIIPRKECFDFKTIGCPQNAFIGLSIGELACPARKNPWAVIAAWKKTFNGNLNAFLIMKLRFTHASQIVRKELLEMIGDDKNIIIHEAEYSDDEMAILQASANVYLSLHRAEGYGLTIHESLELGIPTIASHWSANIEYGPRYDNYFPCNVHMIPYRDWTHHFQVGNFDWAEANLDCVVRYLHFIYDQWSHSDKNRRELFDRHYRFKS